MMRKSSAPRLMSYGDFFAMLEELGAFKSYDYDDATKKSIIGDFEKVLKWSGDPLETHLENILATAKLMETRVYPSDETMYVRVTVQFLTKAQVVEARRLRQKFAVREADYAAAAANRQSLYLNSFPGLSSHSSPFVPF